MNTRSRLAFFLVAFPGTLAMRSARPFQGMSRRSLMFGAGSAIALGRTGPAQARPAASDGGWAKHDGEFTDTELSGFTTSSSGLEYKVVDEGYGVKPTAGQGIKAHYSGYLLNGAKFDSSYDRRSPLGFNVGTGRVIKGWDEALLDMKVGEKRVLKIPPGLAYGSRGAGPIPPGSTLIFYVELVALTS
mmetsp:Transcript_12179/g.29725  ORF Transcript_12179/g.29725 Transcript_12179/m.29725 type:complete len:188 (+) Transcript_12179:57-620(+)|eukprot:CAMPEP_0185190052 /NCGR_PEP_ID=MMETSP1140-20130426/6406_1 /TAXON_ID=298111 /ORGANISM="Pavlova sp., Strain CCMP459" /LENGTH=187 /DNA_ID=CAMNT_0027756649 /DNA_START=34 /DNA_END=597 /DNA_ORIENTATION=+